MLQIPDKRHDWVSDSLGLAIRTATPIERQYGTSGDSRNTLAARIER